jgi:Highly conserved protein containing a thioredoxin domain
LLGSAFDAGGDGFDGLFFFWTYRGLNGQLGDHLGLFKKGFPISGPGYFVGSYILVEDLDIHYHDDDILRLALTLFEKRLRRD